MEQLPGDSRQRNSPFLSYHKLDPRPVRGKRGTPRKEYNSLFSGNRQNDLDEVRGQAILGEEEFGDKLVDHLRKHKDIPEIPKSQRYANRPTLAKIFTEKIVRNKQKRDKKIAEAVEKHLYSQREIAAQPGLHYTSVSRIINERG